MTDRNDHPRRVVQHILRAGVDLIICDATVDDVAPPDNLDAVGAVWR